ncbi:short-chain dehydrogenase/reductase family 16C member 6-like [Adelges cooleyi]|uniref:short-chain dehydrogenase/reductase family 16C member 6-like n=1 Tax=Adelges cooleyi TaxID=133065 RepID=UPI0021806324|nr:short-chain dehydrogenase/reductase family 16C member 6-like [Adelges cooleyi]
MAAVTSNDNSVQNDNTGPERTKSIMDFIPLVSRILFGFVYTMYAFVHLAIISYYPTEKSLKNKVVLVTGAGRGLGREMSLQLAKEGAKVICVDINADGVKETCELIKSDRGDEKDITDFYSTNVADSAQVKELAETVEKKWGQVDILINNAGIVASTPLMEVSDEGIQRMINVNLVSHFWMVRAFLPAMLKRNAGHIVATSSMAAFTCAANIAPYAATKFGVTGFMASLREELRANPNNKIKTTAIHPFFLDSAPINVKHWDVKSVLPSLSIPQVAKAAITGIKREHEVVSVPEFLKFTMCFVWLVPQIAQDYWRDTFKSQIDTV